MEELIVLINYKTIKNHGMVKNTKQSQWTVYRILWIILISFIKSNFKLELMHISVVRAMENLTDQKGSWRLAKESWEEFWNWEDAISAMDAVQEQMGKRCPWVM